MASHELIGREFARQYYTKLSEAPEELHNFYACDAVLVHGATDGDIDHVIGLPAIQEKIRQLKFSECYTKIASVNCSKTLDDGIVIQVCGEQSTNNCPRRPFCQSFVLARHAPKLYFLQSDVFQYLDSIFPTNSGSYCSIDDESCGEHRMNGDDAMVDYSVTDGKVCQNNMQHDGSNGALHLRERNKNGNK